jgi:hypothetical protein
MAFFVSSGIAPQIRRDRQVVLERFRKLALARGKGDVSL